ncbi:hypothetical protein [Pseudotabrizicola sp. L79]|uniref:hypothetical protein n=1 Tax=Pseudotabrizicola sp. L79 TaxID=3118402 RepID=UPI002F9289FE
MPTISNRCEYVGTSPLDTHHRADLSGVAARGETFVVADGQGAAWQLDQGLTLLEKHPLAWDNRLIPI